MVVRGCACGVIVGTRNWRGEGVRERSECDVEG